MRILIVGCSFSELKDKITKTNNWPYFLSIHLKNENVEIINLSKSGNGNRKILTDTITYLEKNKVDLVLIQWSAFNRVFGDNLMCDNNFLHLLKGTKEYFNIDWEYGDNYLDLLSKESIINSLNSIIELQNYLKDKNITYKMWFGWQQVYIEQIDSLSLNHLLEPIKNDDNFLLFYQDDMFDYELENYGLFSKSSYMDTLSKLFGLNKKEYFYPKTEWGGMTEYIRMNLKSDKYRNKSDSHPSQKGHRIFFEGVIKPLFTNTNTILKII